MISDPRGSIEFQAYGSGPTLVLVPGSCSTGSAWRTVVAALEGAYRCVTTSLPGYGGTMERRTARNTSIVPVAEVVETVIRNAAAPVHLVGHSFGGLAALAVALRNRTTLTSLSLLEPPAVEVLQQDPRDQAHDLAFRRMTSDYFSSYASGNTEAISVMIDFYGGAGTFASWPPRVRCYATETTPVNILDWRSAYGFAIPATSLAALRVPVLVVRGGDSHPAMHRITALLSERVRGASLATIEGGAHFMISTHASKVARLIEQHVRRAEAGLLAVP